MPISAGILPPLRHAVLLLVGDAVDLRMPWQVVTRQRRVATGCVQLAEAAAESDVLFRRDILIADYQQPVGVAPGLANLAEQVVPERLAQIEAADFGAESGGDWADRQAHCFLLPRIATVLHPG